MELPLKKILGLLLLVAVGLTFFSGFLASPVQARWVEPDAEVTLVGRGAERARQLLFWLFVTPSLDNTPAIRAMWAVSRNIVLGLFVLMVVFIGLALILGKTGGPVGEIFSGIASPLYGAKLPSILMKVGLFLAFVVFSYVLILGLVQISDILMDFFIKEYVGEDLFNVTLNPENIKNIETSYTEYIGARETSLENMESVQTNLLMVRITTLTYNVMFIALVLRKVILWFLLIVSPFLALLMPFIFIRNIGWIWIGVFFQWLFYGPLLAVFLAGLVQIWKFGIPYAFDWVTDPAGIGRRGDCEGTPFKTATDLLYGGPAQQLSICNSANYVDTYAEYLIGLIMLWAVVLLPWLLLRIFRDYCCEAFRSQESAVMALYNRLAGGFPTPPAPPPIKPAPAAKFQLPFRAKAPLAREEKKAISLAEISQISRAETREILRAMNLEVQSIRDVAQYEINTQKQLTAQETLTQLSQPTQVPEVAERRKFATLRQELASRAQRGDIQAQRALTAAEGKMPAIAAAIQRPAVVARPIPVRPEVEEVATAAMIGVITQDLSRRARVGDQKAQQALKTVQGKTPMASLSVLEQELGERAQKGDVEAQRILQVAQKEKEKIITRAQKEAAAPAIVKPVPPTPVSLEEYEEVKKMWANHYREAEVPISDQVKTRQDWLQVDLAQISNTIEMLIAKETEVKQRGYDQVAALLPFLLLGGFSEQQTITYLKAKLEAARTVLEEIERVRTAKEEVKKEAEELVEVPRPKVEEKPEEIELKAALERKLEKPTREQVAPTVIGAFSAAQLIGAKTRQLMKAINLAVSSMKDVASIEMSRERRQAAKQTLANIFQPAQVTRIEERQNFTTLKEELESRAQRGDLQAQKILIAAEAKPKLMAALIQKPALPVKKEIVAKPLPVPAATKILHQELDKRAQRGDLQAQKVLEANKDQPMLIAFRNYQEEITARAQEGDFQAQKVLTEIEGKPVEAPTVAKPIPPTPVSLEEYEEIKRMWVNHYQRAEVPISDQVKDRGQWLRADLAQISDTIELLASKKAEDKQRGYDQVAEILPFLLLGGFSEQQVVTYLKGKKEAVRTVLSEIEKPPTVRKEAVEEELVERPVVKKEVLQEEIIRAVKPVPITLTTARLTQIIKMGTKNLLKAVDLQIDSIKDVAQYEMDEKKRELAQATLAGIHQPAQAPQAQERECLTTLKGELTSRAQKGDIEAQRTLVAAQGETPAIASQVQSPTGPKTAVSVEDYEEAKRMWVNHYQRAEVPISDQVKDRGQWLRADLAQISDTIELLASKKAEDKQRGYDQVAEILPFLLLGGFSEEQTVTYLKGKLEAIKIVQDELEAAEKIRQEAKEKDEKEEEPEEELVEAGQAQVEKTKESETTESQNLTRTNES